MCDIMQVKFVKFFAWEDRWINRAMDSREAELKWMVEGKVNYLGDANFLMIMVIQARLNSVLFFALWGCGTIFISIISFFTYVMLGNQLTIGVAFTVRFV